MATIPPIAVVGQTASGKSDLALDLAEVLGVPIISADAMQLYRGLDIGTAKVPVEERRGIPHFQLDQLDVHEDASVAAYQKYARSDLDRVGGSAVVAGGSGLYLRAFLDHFEFPGQDPAIRSKLNEEGKTLGTDALHSRLQGLDPTAAAAIHPNNLRRVVRALEVIQITGRPFSASLPRYEYVYPGTIQIAIAWEKDHLDLRINQRSKKIFDEGIIEEARLLEGLKDDATACKATGYREARAVLAGEMTVDDAITQVALATRQLASRQLKWFRRDPRIHWLPAGPRLLERALEAANFDNSKSFA